MKVIRGLSEQSISLGFASFASSEDELIFTDHYYRSLRESKKQLQNIMNTSSTYWHVFIQKGTQIGKKCMDFLYTR